jgi:hypothetical protein
MAGEIRMRRFGVVALCAAGLLTVGGARADTFVLSNTMHPKDCGLGVDFDCTILDGNGYVQTLADGSTELVGSDESNPGPPGQAQAYGTNGPFNRTNYLATALQDETLVYSFEFLTFDDFGTQFDPASEDVNDARTQISVTLPEHSIGLPNAPQFGTVTFGLKAGDVYGFDIFTDSRDGAGTLTFKLRSSSLPSVAPEPAVWTILLAGFAGVGAALRRRRVGDTA